MDSLSVVPGIPDKAYYIPNFITEEEEKNILSHVYSAPKPKWTCLSNRKLQNWGGIPHPKGMIAEEIPNWLKKCMDKTTDIHAFPNDKPPNHVLVNEYLPNQGIMQHLDGPLFYPTICTITCGSYTVLNFHPKQDKEADGANSKIILASLLLEPRSLIIIKEDLYHIYPHSIEEKTSDVIDIKTKNLSLCSRNYENNQTLNRDTRISLTIRHVPQTTKFKIKLFK